MERAQIRNFCIIAHIDHGKSTLADRFLELTGTVEARKMRAQLLDTMDLERERGITIKLQPVRMTWSPLGENSKFEYRNSKQIQNSNDQNLKRSTGDVSDWPHHPSPYGEPSGFRASDLSNSEYTLNLIDTPGHVDFSYEVSRSLEAVEGAILLVDATQGVQAQTLANLEMARRAGLKIIPAVNKVDLPEARSEEVAFELSAILGCEPDAVQFVSAKTGKGVEELLERVIREVPPPRASEKNYPRALIFDSYYDDYRGVVVYVRVFDGEINKSDPIYFVEQKKSSEASDVGMIQLALKSTESLKEGEIGFIVSALKDVSQARVGDTVTVGQSRGQTIEPLPGYREPKPMVYAEIYSTSGEDFGRLRDSLAKLKLSDSALVFEPKSSTAFGFGFRCGFLGLLHLEIVKERLEREYDLRLVITTPTVDFRRDKEGKYFEPYVKAEIILPSKYLGAVMEIAQGRRGVQKNLRHLEDKVILEYEMPLSEIIVDFYDAVKSASKGYGSVSYEVIGSRESDLVQLDVLLAGEKVEAFSRLVYRSFIERVARQLVGRMKELIPRQNFEVKIQAALGGRIIAAERIAPYRKDVTEKLYGGDVTRKRKLLEKQKKGKKKMAQVGRVELPSDVFVKLLKY